MKRAVLSVILFAVVALSAAYLSGCETFKGTGRDISNLGKLISGD